MFNSDLHEKLSEDDVSEDDVSDDDLSKDDVSEVDPLGVDRTLLSNLRRLVSIPECSTSTV